MKIEENKIYVNPFKRTEKYALTPETGDGQTTECLTFKKTAVCCSIQ
jgi:hypothetical protein